MDHGSTTKHSSTNNKNSDVLDEDLFDDSIMEIFDNSDFNETAHPDQKEKKSDLKKSLLNVSALCCDEELSGYDKLTGQTWIYPTNYPVRDYQFNIIKAAMLENCLVSLPTGLGKTFIAAVVMYNFYRWYPLGKIIFTAPTRPLVAQQIEACYNIVAMPPKDTIEMTGQMQANIRKTHWQTKRVFFATPQVIYNDIKSGLCPGDKIRCIVIDEAHKAKGNYAYGNIISTLTEMGHFVYRVLALSATPGNKIEDVIHIVKHLHISRLELRTENCLDVRSYSHARKINTVVVELGPELMRLRQQYVEILDGYTRKLKNFNIIQNLGNLSKGRIVMLYKEFQCRERGARHPQHSYIMRTFTLLITLYHGLELLVKHGARVFLNFFDEHPEKTWVQFDNELTSFFEKLRNELGINPLSLDRSVLPDGTIADMPSNLNFGHPKFDKLKEIMLEHFIVAKKQGQVTKAIVFCEYRESVNLVHCLLLQCRPMIVPEMFVGHGASGKDGKASLSQKQQLRVMRDFRSGSCNALVCTCVAEEGLDVGAVDLILCFDVSTRSPVRLVQRCGRTGRERSGQVFILVTEGREHSTLLDSIRQNDGLNQRIHKSEEVKKNLYKSNPRMVPRGFTPECQKMFITVAKKESKEKPKEAKEKAKDNVLKGQKDLRSMFLNKTSSKKSSQKDEKNDENNKLIFKEEFDDLFPEGYSESNFFSRRYECWTLNKETRRENNNTDTLLKPSSCLESVRKLQKTFVVGHSSDTKLLTELFQRNKDAPTTKSPVKKSGDIRVLFSKATKSIKNYTKSMNELGIHNNLNMSSDILNLLVDLSLQNKTVAKRCYMCDTICNCSGFLTKTEKFTRPHRLCSYMPPNLPDMDLIDDLKAESLRKFVNEFKVSNVDTHRAANDIQKTLISVDRRNTNITDTTWQVGDTNSVPKAVISNDSNLDFCDNDIFDVSDIFDEIETSTEVEVGNTTPVATKSSEERLAESTLHDVVINEHEITKNYLQNDINDGDCKDICHNYNTFEDNILFEGTDTSGKKTPPETRPPLNSISSVKKQKISPLRGINKKIESKNTSMEIDGDIHRDENQSIWDNYNATEVDDIFEDIDTTVLTSTKSSPTLGIIAKSPILKSHDSYKNNNVEVESDMNYVSRKKICDNLETSEVNDIFGDIDTAEKLKQNKSNITTIENDIFDDDDVLEDIEISNEIISEKSSIQLDSNTERTLKGTIEYVCIENDFNNVLKYFHLKKVSDIFKDPYENTLQVKSGLINISMKNNLILNEIICDEKNIDNNQLNTSVECPSSPSLLSGRSKSVISSRSTSPILNSQKSKTNLKLNKQTSPILNSQRRKISLSLNRSRKKLNTSMLNDDIFPNSVQVNNMSPITEAEHTEMVKLEKPQLNASEIIILDSDDEDFEDVFRDTDKLSDSHNNTMKRKFDEPEHNKSPYFKKKPKLNDNFNKPSTMKEKLIAALTSHKNLDTSFSNNVQINFMLSPTEEHKENKDPLKCKLEMLKKFQYDTENKTKNILERSAINILPSKVDYKSDDDFKTEMPHRKKILTKLKSDRIRNNTKKKKGTEFLDLEAELSEELSASGDELSSDSEGSLVNFICDDVGEHKDIHAIYLESVKSPVKGVFKMPQLPPLKRHEILSQYVEEDTYEMDSFCVDSHIVLNETNEVSELELAEIILEERRRSKKKRNQTVQDPEGSLIVKKSSRNVRRQIHSDSEDSS